MAQLEAPWNCREPRKGFIPLLTVKTTGEWAKGNHSHAHVPFLLPLPHLCRLFSHIQSTHPLGMPTIHFLLPINLSRLLNLSLCIFSTGVCLLYINNLYKLLKPQVHNHVQLSYIYNTTSGERRKTLAGSVPAPSILVVYLISLSLSLFLYPSFSSLYL